MKSVFFALVFFFSVATSWSQSEERLTTTTIDSLYKEDQFFVGLTYNVLVNTPNGVSQRGFSSSVQFGFIKDMPINNKRNLAIGLGLGTSFNVFNQNIKISESNNDSALQVIDSDYSRNKFFLYALDVPLEFRWRTSTASEYKFWRIYPGFKFSYVFFNRAKYRGEPENITINNSSVFNKILYGITLSAGYNSWNFYAYYGLNPIFKSDAKIEGSSVDTKSLRVGLIFYIL